MSGKSKDKIWLCVSDGPTFESENSRMNPRKRNQMEGIPVLEICLWCILGVCATYFCTLHIGNTNNLVVVTGKFFYPVMPERD